MSKNVIWWIGVKNPQLAEKYGGYDYFEYSKNTWKHFCERFDCEFVEFSEPVEQIYLNLELIGKKPYLYLMN